MADYDERELGVMRALGRTPETVREAQVIHEIKARFDARIVEKETPVERKNDGPLCRKHNNYWLASGGRQVCRVCHPPAPGAELKEALDAHRSEAA